MFGRRPSVTSICGVVAAAHPLAAQAGIRLLVAGGNAFDAAVATAATLNVVEPCLSGLAGMGVATCYVAAEGRARSLDFVTPVPSRFEARARRRSELYRGPHGIGTPASLAGWCALLERYGSKSRAEVFEPAIELARDGFPVTEFYIQMARLAVDQLRAFEGWADLFTDGGEPPAPGWVLRQPDLARTYEAVVDEGPSYLHEGPLGRAMVEYIQELGGCLTLEDLARVEPQWLAPLTGPYRDLLLHTLPPPCEGFQMLLTMRMLERVDLASLPPNEVEHLDTVIRAIRLAAELRIRHNNPPVEKVRELLGEDSVGRLCERLADPEPISGRTEQFGDPPQGVPPESREHTTSFSVADAEGNMVCITQSLGGGFGSGVVIPGYGVAMNDFLYWGDLHPESRNFMAPNAPLALPIAPTVSTRQGAPVLALGTPGSYGICQTQAQAMVQLVDHGLDIQAAIEAPRVRVHDGAEVLVESRIRAETVAALRARGHEAQPVEPWSVHAGGMQGLTRDPASGALQGGADPRRDGYAIGI